jgi:carbonic anhydrase/acetyltransferase-like protein (isoleucine patch superfamily)
MIPPLFKLGRSEPKFDPTVFIAPSAVIIGDVTIGAQSGIWFHSVLRGDDNSITIGARSNIQDGTVIHVDPGAFSVHIGDDVTVGHSCLIHGCRLESRSFVGMASTVMNGCVIEAGGVLGARSLLTADKRIKTGELWTGAPAKFVRNLTDAEMGDFAKTSTSYVRKAARYLSELAVTPTT